MSGECIYIVEDDTYIVELLEVTLRKAGYETHTSQSGEEAVKQIRKQQPALVLLDLMLPGMDGLEVCRALKSDGMTRTIPVVMVTAKGEESDIIVGLEMGADDYLTKPFSPKVLIARIRAVLRRQVQAVVDEESIIEVHNLLIHPGRHEVRVDDAVVEMTVTEFRVLHCLARRPGWVLTRDQIVDALHGPGYPVTDRAVDVQIVGLRKKLGAAGELVETVRGIGYRLREA
jgi:two-component system phosphate regulon response regulator PhoB